ncbi:MAG: EAL domain-containing protein, partial [Undibacterium sp.]|nr:EAL domain-containing protein [Undibacterium sp.]
DSHGIRFDLVDEQGVSDSSHFVGTGSNDLNQHIPPIDGALQEWADTLGVVWVSYNTRLSIVTEQKGFRVRVSTDSKHFYAEANRHVRLAGIYIVGMLLFGLCMARIVAQWMIVRPIDHLVEVVTKFGLGDFSARVGAPYSNTEIGLLGRVFDAMASYASIQATEQNEKNISMDLQVALRTKELFDEKLRLVLALEGGQLGFWDKNLLTEEMISSQLHAQMFGYDVLPPQWNMDLFLEHVYMEDRERVKATYFHAIQNGQYYDEFRVLWADGSVHWLKNVGQVIYDERKAVRMIGVISDITFRKNSETTLAASEQRFRAILEASADGVVICDPKGKIILVNEQAERLFLYQREVLIGQVVENLVPQRLQQQHLQNRHQYGLSSKPQLITGAVSMMCLRADGDEFAADIIFTPVVLDGREVTIVSIRDVTIRVRNENELARTNRTLRVLSRCNEILVRAENETHLLQSICETLVAVGGYQFCWIGLQIRINSSTLKVASTKGGNDIELTHGEILWVETEGSVSAIARAINSGEVLVSNKQDDPDVFQFWHSYFDLEKLSSLIILPLGNKGASLGALVLYADHEHKFDPPEIGLLKELAADVGYGLSSLRDKTERDHYLRKSHYQENFDALTGLANRHLFLDRLGQAMQNEIRNEKMIAILQFSLDRFQLIAGSFGETCSDQILKVVSERLIQLLPEGDTIARFAPFEFAIILCNLKAVDDTLVVIHKIMNSIGSAIPIENSSHYLTASMGISVFPKDSSSSELLTQYANIAMHSAQKLGGNTYQFYAVELNEQIAKRLLHETAMRKALELDQFEVYFQPKVSLKTGEITGAEAVIRWFHPELGNIPSSEFISLAEDTGLIIEIGRWTLINTCQQMRSWLDLGIEIPPVSINLSTRQFTDEMLPQTIKTILEKYAIDPALIVLEVTEGTAMVNLEKGILALKAMKSIGIKLSIDDFGTGYSSLANLKRLPLDQLKIDRAFVKDITIDLDARAICLAIIGLAHTLKLTAVAEGVETEAQMHILRRHHCDELQGYFFSPPICGDEFKLFLQSQKTLDLNNVDVVRQPTLLLVDDEQNIVSALKRLLRRDEYQILTANSGAEGLDLLANNTVDVIMSDQRMPGMMGADFLRRAKELYPQTVRIMLSGYTELQSVTDAVNEGAIYKFLTKPWEDELLRVHVQEAFKLKSIFDENQNLSEAILVANTEMAVTNRKMEEMLLQKTEQIARVETSLAIVREVVHRIAYPVIGLDDEGLIVFVNKASEELFVGLVLLGEELAQISKELFLCVDSRPIGSKSVELEIRGKTYQIFIHAMGSDFCLNQYGHLLIFEQLETTQY